MKKKINHVIDIVYSKFEIGVIVVLAFIPLAIVAIHIFDLPSKAPVREDGVGYYAYLPAVFVYQDLQFDFMIDEDVPYTEGQNSFERVFNPREAKVMGFNQLENGNILDKYPIGVSVMLAPFFVVGHIFSLIFGTALTGWSFFYQYFSFYGGVVYFALGVVILKRLLSQYFSKGITLFSFIAVVFGTSLLNYATYENMFSHVYSFFLITLLLYFTPKWLEKIDVWRSMIMGLILGLIFIVRNTNALFFLIPILYGVGSLGDIKERIKLFASRYTLLFVTVASLCVVVLPQFLYWKYTSGDWVAYSYGEEEFRFLRPQIFNVLFSTQKGLFFWAPVLLFAVPGFALLKGKVRKYLFPIILVSLLQLYIVSSWWSWQYGWSFGHRAFVDMMGIFAIGIASFYEAIKNERLKIMTIIISGVLVLLSIFQMGQYWLKILPPADTTFEDYKRVFLNLDMDNRYFWRGKFKELDN